MFLHPNSLLNTIVWLRMFFYTHQPAAAVFIRQGTFLKNLHKEFRGDLKTFLYFIYLNNKLQI